MVSAVIGSAEEAAQQGVHYLLLDVCLTCLKWPSIFPALHRGASPGLPAEVQLAADALMDYLVSNATVVMMPMYARICSSNFISSCISTCNRSKCDCLCNSTSINIISSTSECISNCISSCDSKCVTSGCIQPLQQQSLCQ